MKSSTTSPRIETLISELLRWGVALSLVLAVAGTVLCFLRGSHYGAAGGTTEDFHRLLREDAGPSLSMSGLVRGLAQLQGEAVIIAGLILLIATPVVRVFVSMIAFAVEKDRAYVAITAVVFILLLVSLFLGKAG